MGTEGTGEAQSGFPKTCVMGVLWAELHSVTQMTSSNARL